MKVGKPKESEECSVKIVLVRAPRFMRGVLSKIFGIERKNK